MISVQEVEALHQLLIEQFGGSSGIRDGAGLASALARPFQSFAGQSLYPSPLEQASALLESILSNHPFVDGNKRTGYTLMRIWLLQNGYDFSATQQGRYDFIIAVASGKMNYADILEWTLKNTTPIKPVK